MKRELENIIKGCLKKDRKSQFLFFEMFSPWAYTICRRYVYDSNKAKEVLQDAFLRIFSKLDAYDSSKGELKSWMARILINCSLTTTKKEAFNDSFMSLSNMTKEPISEDVFFQFTADDIMKFLHEMPLGYKTIFNLSVMDEFTHKEIAAQLGISEITSRSQLRKAKIWLQDNISKNSIKANF